MILIPDEKDIDEALITLKEALVAARKLVAEGRIAYRDLDDRDGLERVNKAGIQLLDNLQDLQEQWCKLAEMSQKLNMSGAYRAGLALLEEKDVYLHQLMERKKAQVQNDR